MPINIAIDGHSSCGKSTLARELAAKLHYRYVDSGAMYRAITLFMIRHQIDIANEQAVNDALGKIALGWHQQEGAATEITLNGERVGQFIRDLSVADHVSQVAAIKSVRQFAVAQQQAMGLNGGVVMDGRDVGTVVFPTAALKIFLTADPAIRVKRRFLEMAEGNDGIAIEDICHNLEMRDYIDSNRAEGPLVKAADARVLDNSDLDRDAQLKKALQWAQEAVALSAAPNP